MKITVKTTQQKVFQVDVEGQDTIATLKDKIQESQGHAAATQKIIYSGKVLVDDKTIESCGIKEKDFLVLMVSKPKPTPAPAPSTSAAPAEAPAPAAPSQPVTAPSTGTGTAPAPAPAPATDVTMAAPLSTPSTSAPAFGDLSSFLSGEGLQSAINNMVEMGFPKEQVLRAMRASFNNPDRAVEYLMNGIPAHLEAESARQAPTSPPQSSQAPAPAPAAAAAAAAAPSSNQPQPGQPQNLFQLAQQQQQGGGVPGGGNLGGPGAGAGAGGLNLEALRDNPQIQLLRQQMAQNPGLIQPLIQQLATQNPAIAQMIAQNPEALFQLLGIELDDEEGGNGGQPPQNAHTISVTEEERAAILRLEGLGFPRHAVLEAYFACDKNEELAANYLFEGGFDD
ncbi:UV excision repair protein rhp23 [Psilocybe cubensis]|uniref:UV excision repair protein rhp23 n=2 Tax=Psilocybe cubensis TaxID=181762 RepID=A0ACB8HBG6_PSICU|nr:UV excision repair protein rhp23 [Psilocybe cubensis]KAH9485343.1 UV excision repair protein rhp23 [Psilocybe cubensis]